MNFIAVLVAAIVSTAVFAVDETSELNSTKCVHYKKRAGEPLLFVTFKKEENDFVRVTIKERFTSRYTGRNAWGNIHDASEQVSSSNRSFKIGIENLSLTIDRPVPETTPSHSNATLVLENGTKIELRCERIENKR